MNFTVNVIVCFIKPSKKVLKSVSSFTINQKTPLIMENHISVSRAYKIEIIIGR